MADDNQANYGRIGFTLLMGIALIVGVFVYFGGVGTNKEMVPAETFFHNPVTGLAPGADVCFRGVKVGSVKRMSFIGNEYPNSRYKQAIWVELAFDSVLIGGGSDKHHPVDELRRIVEKGLHATVSASLLTGIAHIELDFPKSEVQEAPCDWRPRTICIPPAPTLLQSASDTIPKVLNKLDKMDLVGSWSNVMATVEAAHTLMGTAGALVESQQGNIGEILSNMRDASASLRDLANQLRDNPSLLLRAQDPQPLAETAR